MSEELKARIAELESWYAASQESQRELLKRIALADRLAEAADHVLDAWGGGLIIAKGEHGLLEEMRRLEEALAAYRNGGDDG